MHVKTYTGKSTQSILAQIKEELGPEAIILSNRTLRKSGERIYEVTAGVDRHMGAAPAPAAGASKSTAKAAYTAAEDRLATTQARVESEQASRQRVRQMASQVIEDGQFSDMPSHAPLSGHAGMKPTPRKPRTAPTTAAKRNSRARNMSSNDVQSSDVFSSGMQPLGWGEWHKDWLQMKDHLFALMKPSMQLEKLTPRQKVALEHLQREGVSDDVVLELYRRLLAAPGDSVLESLSEIVPVSPWCSEIWPQRIHCFTGPFGAGKTTAALRMALQLRAKNPEIRIAFINADCQRGNGRLLLRHWAELSDFGYTEAADEQSMSRALIASSQLDKVFIDLPSLSNSQTLHEQYRELGIEGDNAGEKATHIALAPMYDKAQLINFLQRYAPDSAGSLIWAKLDEAMSFGSLVNAAAVCQLPVSALSCGAELRGSLVSATESLLWRLIFKRQLPLSQ